MSIFDAVKDTLEDAIQIYGQVEAVKLQTELARAQASAAAINLPTQSQNIEARAQNTMPNNGGNTALLIGAGVVALFAGYVILKK